MKIKLFFAIMIAITLMLGVVTPVYAADLRDFEEETALLLSLLSEEVIEELNAYYGEDLISTFVTWLDAMGYELTEEEIERYAGLLNSSPVLSLYDISLILSSAGLWGAGAAWAELAAQLSFGEDITREDVAVVIEAIAEFYLEFYDANLTEIIETAELSRDNLIEILWFFVDSSDFRGWFIQRYDESWVFHAVNEIISEVITTASFEGTESAAMHLRRYWVSTESIRILGLENAELFFSLFDVFESFLVDEVTYTTISSSSLFLEKLAALVEEYGIDGFMELYNFNLRNAIEALLEDSPPLGLIYLDELLDGLITDNIAVFSQALEEVRTQEINSQTWGAEQQEWANWEMHIDILEALADFITNEEATSLTANDLERKFTFEINEDFLHTIAVNNENNRLNLFYENTTEYNTLLVYFVIGGIYPYATMTEVEIKPGERFTTQINLTDTSMSGWWFADVLFLNTEDGLPNGVFSFRMTEYPLGHPSHG